MGGPVEELIRPQRRVSSRLLIVEEGEFDLDLEPLEMDERDSPTEQLNNWTHSCGFVNTKRF